jgi:hypothetical protein
MIITLGTGAAAFILAQTPDPIPMRNLRINGEHVIQEEAVYGAAAKVFFDRGNQRTVVTFETTRLFGTPLEAETFLLQHAGMFPYQGLVTFYSGIAGQKTYTSYLINAVVAQAASGISGLTTRHSYRTAGGVFSATPT